MLKSPIAEEPIAEELGREQPTQGMLVTVRIGTWNLAGRWTAAHRDLLMSQNCDVWLLTEVRDDVSLEGYQRHLTTGLMAKNRRWAGVFSREPLEPIVDPHPASAAVTVGGATYCSSILPWRSCGPVDPWVGETHNARISATLDQLKLRLPRRDLVWGGDWNQGLVGPEYAGSLDGRTQLLELLDHLRLSVPTAELPHRRDKLATIDHIGVGRDVAVISAEQCKAPTLSDHDIYVIEV